MYGAPTLLTTMLGFSVRRLRRSAGLLVLSLSSAGGLHGQAAVDPNVAPRAAALERGGERQLATDMLGRYLATAPDDGRAWFQLGRFYLLDARDWHLRGHQGEPSGALYLDFAATALEQSVRLYVDSGVVYRGYVEMERVRIFVEDSGWAAARDRRPWAETPSMPLYIVELGVNLLGSCPADGVLLTGTDLETLSVWYGALEARHRPDILPLRPDLYATDSLYRRRMADVLGVDPDLSVQRALIAAAARRPLCLSPTADSAAAPTASWVPLRLVRVSHPDAPPTSDVLSVTELLKVEREGGAPFARDVREIYSAAARHNARLCGGLLGPLGGTAPLACGP